VLSLPPSVRLFVATQPVDGRKGTDSLMVLVRDVFGHDPLSGHLFIFWLFRRICGRENESDVAFGARHVARIAGSGGRPARELRAERR